MTRLIRFPRWWPQPFNPRAKLTDLQARLLAVGMLRINR